MAARSTRRNSRLGKRQSRAPIEYWKVSQDADESHGASSRERSSRAKRVKIYTGEGKNGLATPQKAKPTTSTRRNSRTRQKKQEVVERKSERVARAPRKPIIVEDSSSESEIESLTESEIESGTESGSESSTSEDYYASIEFILDVREEKEKSKEYLVKYKGVSYLHTEWLREDDLSAASQVHKGLAQRLRKFQLYESKRGVDPDFIVVERVIAEKYNKQTKERTFLVKWMKLPYSEATWEEEETCVSEAPGFESACKAFRAKKPIFSLAQEQLDSVKDGDTEGSRVDPCEACKFGSLQLAARRSSSKKRRNGSGADSRSSKRSADFKKYEETPEFLKEGGTLYPYQLDGLNWLEFSWQTGKHVILGDEMGLGKTVQAIAFVASLASRGCAMPHIVVGPLSTLLNWEREFQKWAPHLNVVTYSGTIVDRDVIYKNELFAPTTTHKGVPLSKRIKFHVLLTTYEMILADRPQLSKFGYASLIIDEGHRLKSRSSKLFDALRQFKCDQRVILTGTPLQNNLEELFMLMHFIDPKKFTDNEIEDFLLQYADIDKKEQIEELHRLLKPHLLRRMKNDVLKELPPKKEQIVLVEMSHEQKDMYKALLTSNYAMLSSKSGTKVTGLKNLLMELRKCCLHPCLLTKDYKTLSRKGDRLAQFTKLSGKLQLLERMLEKLMKRGHRTLIYSQFTTVLDLIMEWLHLKRIPSLIIDGSIKGKERQNAVDTFNSEQEKYQIFLLSTRAGGLGINLATADTVIIFDSDWNPHNDLQAQARAHRLGQSKEVMIYRLVTRASVEERMVEQAKKKMVLEHLVVRKGGKELQMKQEEVDDIIRFGVSELFQKEEDFQKLEATKKGSEELPLPHGKESLASKEQMAGRVGGNKSKGVYYDDEALDKILDRKVAWEEHNKEQVNSVEEVKDAEYLQAFKVANFEVQEGNFWEEVLEEAHQAAIEGKVEETGRGKRKRKNLDEKVINFINSGKDDYIYEEDYKPNASDSSSSEDSDSDSDSECTKMQKALRAKQKEEQKEKQKEAKSESVANGFSRADKRNFFNLFMRYGQGKVSEEGHSDFRQIKDRMKNKSEADVQEYGILFLNGLVDTSGEKELSPKELLIYSEMRVKDERMSILHRLADLHFLGSVQSVKPEKFEEVKGESVLGKKNWKVADDFHLVQGVLKHGYGQWKLVAADETLGLYDAIAYEVLDEEARAKSTRESMDHRIPVWVKRRITQITRILAGKQATRKDIDTEDLFLSLYDRYPHEQEKGTGAHTSSRFTVAAEERNNQDPCEVIMVNSEDGEVSRKVDTSDDGDSQSDVIIVEKDSGHDGHAGGGNQGGKISDQRLRLQEAVRVPQPAALGVAPASAAAAPPMGSSIFNLSQLSGLNPMSDLNQLFAAQLHQASGLHSMAASLRPDLFGAATSALPLMSQMVYGQASGLNGNQNPLLAQHQVQQLQQHQQHQGQGLDPTNRMLEYQQSLEQKLMTMTQMRQSLPASAANLFQTPQGQGTGPSQNLQTTGNGTTQNHLQPQ